MPKTLFHSALFLAGLAVVCWIGAGYLGSNPLGAGFAALIGLCYLAGVAELYRYRQATATLHTALRDAEAARSDLGGWLQRLHPSLRNAVRLRIEGERTALPVPALTPYLVGLLVLLGMLGTFLGMMATLRGTGLALDSATDLHAIRASLAAPLKGLGFAFGTSIAGVAASAMLGLLAALCRRERLQAVQQLDLHAATALRTHSLAYQRNEAFKLLQTQATLMPSLIERMQTMMAALEQHSAVSGERLASSQDAFHSRTEAAYTRLAGAVEHALQAGVAAHARAFGDALEPVVQRTLDGVARETAALQDTVGQAVQRQLDGLASGFAQAAEQATQRWDSALAEQQRVNGVLLQELGSALQRAGDGLEQRATTLVEATGTPAGRQRRRQASLGRGADATTRGQRQPRRAPCAGIGHRGGPPGCHRRGRAAGLERRAGAAARRQRGTGHAQCAGAGHRGDALGRHRRGRATRLGRGTGTTARGQRHPRHAQCTGAGDRGDPPGCHCRGRAARVERGAGAATRGQRGPGRAQCAGAGLRGGQPGTARRRPRRDAAAGPCRPAGGAGSA